MLRNFPRRVVFFVMNIIISHHHKFNQSGLLATDSSCQGAQLNINVGQHGAGLPHAWPSPQAYNPISNTKNHKDHSSWLSISYMARTGSDSQRLHDVMTSKIFINKLWSDGKKYRGRRDEKLIINFIWPKRSFHDYRSK